MQTVSLGDTMETVCLKCKTLFSVKNKTFETVVC